MHAAPVATTADAWGYRPALDGLRTIAVYLVLLFHAGLARAANGYLGVDVFFVLSGFLVTNVMLAEHGAQGRLDLRRFYARRVRRLLPAAVVLVVAVAAASVLVLPRLERVRLITDARSALLYVANWHFLGDATDYFADDVGHSPFLHFWSLAIEEQFYVVYPLVLVGALSLARRRGRPWLVPAVLAALLVGSLAAQALVASRSSLDAYYATHTRLYQLLAGALLAAAWSWTARAREVLARPVRRSRTTGGGVIAGAALAALVALSTDVVGLSVSRRGMLAALLTVLVVLGVEASPTSWLARALARPTATYLGRISYGTYLWHWPLIVLTRAVLDLSAGQTAVVAAVGATALAALSFQLLETPIRRTPRLARWPRAVVAAGLSCSVVAAVSIVPPLLRSDRRPAIVASNAGVDPSASAARAAELARALIAPAPTADALDAQLVAAEPPAYDPSACDPQQPTTCVVRRGGGQHVHLIGDSNAMVLIPAFTALAEEHDLTVSASVRVGCPWQLGLTWVSEDHRLVAACEEAREDWYERIVPALQPDVIVAAHVPRDPGTRDDGALFVAAGRGAATRDGTARAVVAEATEASIDRLVATGAQVVLVEPLPYDAQDPAVCLSGASSVGACAFQIDAEPFPTEEVYRELDQRRADVVAIDADRIACPFLPVCVPAVEGVLVFRNQFHLGNAWLVDHADELWGLLLAAGAVRAAGAASAAGGGIRRSAPAAAGTR